MALSAAGSAAQLLLLLLLSGHPQQLLAQVPFVGSCPSPPVVQSFNSANYLGRWYEQKKYFAVFELGGKCIRADYGDAGNGVISVVNTQTSKVLGKTTSISGQAVVVDNSGAARLRVSFNGVPSFGSSDTANYNVVETDYTSYSVVWSCSDYTLFNSQFLWILTRSQVASPALIRQIEQRLRGYGLNTSKLKATIQIGCTGRKKAKPDNKNNVKEP